MKNNIISGIIGAMCMLVFLIVIASIQNNEVQLYVHSAFISEIEQENCYICGQTDGKIKSVWGEDNVGIVNLNTFETMYIGINRYDESGTLVMEPAGVMEISGIIDNSQKSYANASAFPDNGFARVQITGVQYRIDRDKIQRHLCQQCLDSINEMWFNGNYPAEYGVISFSENTIQPLLKSHPWFSAGNFGIDCEFKENDEIGILIHYCPNQYE